MLKAIVVVGITLAVTMLAVENTMIARNEIASVFGYAKATGASFVYYPLGRGLMELMLFPLGLIIGGLVFIARTPDGKRELVIPCVVFVFGALLLLPTLFVAALGGLEAPIYEDFILTQFKNHTYRAIGTASIEGSGLVILKCDSLGISCQVAASIRRSSNYGKLITLDYNPSLEQLELNEDGETVLTYRIDTSP